MMVPGRDSSWRADRRISRRDPDCASLVSPEAPLTLRPVFQRWWKPCLLLLTAAIVAGCHSTPALVAQGRAIIPVQTEPGAGGLYEAAAHLMNEVVIQLPPVRTPGNVWTVVLNDIRFFHQLRPVEMHPDGTGTATFLAIRAGRRPIRFFALPPNAREAEAKDFYEIRLTIQ